MGLGYKYREVFEIDQSALRLHSDNMSTFNPLNDPFTCSQCDQTFIWKADLLKHMRLHHNNVKYECLQCGITFTEKHNLTRHQHAKHGDGHKCGQCEKLFNRMDSLKRHQLTCKGIQFY